MVAVLGENLNSKICHCKSYCNKVLCNVAIFSVIIKSLSRLILMKIFLDHTLIRLAT